MWDRFEAGGYGEDGDTKDLILGASIRRLAQAEAGIDGPVVFIGDRDTDAQAAAIAGVGFIGIGEDIGGQPRSAFPALVNYEDTDRLMDTIDQAMQH